MAGQKVGLFGLTLQGPYPKYVRCTDPDSAARLAVDTLQHLGVDLLVALTHQTVEADRALLNREGRLDLILGGHEHEHITVAVANRYILKADANSRTAQFATIWGTREHWHEAVALLPVQPTIAPDTAVAPVVAAWADSLRQKLGPERTVGTLTAPLDARDEIQRRAETGLGDLVTDAIRAGTGADVALLNAGALRLDDLIRAGPVTNYQVESLFLFADETRILVVPLSGNRVRELLERSVSDSVLGKGGFLQVSGVAFTYDSTKPAGSRIVGDLTRATGRPLRAADSVRVALPAYLSCDRGDGYQVPEVQDLCHNRNSAPRAVDLLRTYLVDSLHRTVTPPPPGRINRR
jgi:2',3'-cyclic-nucleotide 2'-phosphodiesterase (5'-nucleotidase family)